jgi:histidyl-tRNA synthetase
MKPLLSTEPYKGVRDFYPDDQRTLNHLFSVSRNLLHAYGYEEYNASPLESAELYEGKTSDEIVRDQTYTFVDRGDRRVTLRPEMTPTVARMVAGKRRELAFPLRWFSIPNVFRYERPQRGRLREHFQLNIDLFGVKDFNADLEIIVVAHALLTAFGAKQTDFELRINSRTLVNAACIEAGLTPEQAKEYLRLVDRIDKLEPDVYAQEKEAILRGAPDPDALIAKPTPNSPVAQAKDELEAVLVALKNRGIDNARYDKSVARGFDYYTGIVFEVFDTHPDNRRSIFGGGRYDGLTSLFSDEQIPAVGCAVGDVTLRDFLETHALLSTPLTETDVYVCSQSSAFIPHADMFAAKLRDSGVRAAVHIGDRKIGDQIKIADKKGIRHIVVVGEIEVQSGTYTLKNLLTGEEFIGSAKEIADRLVTARPE